MFDGPLIYLAAILAVVLLLFAIRSAIRRCWLGHDYVAYEPDGYVRGWGIPMEKCIRCDHIHCDSGRCP